MFVCEGVVETRDSDQTLSILKKFREHVLGRNILIEYILQNYPNGLENCYIFQQEGHDP